MEPKVIETVQAPDLSQEKMKLPEHGVAKVTHASTSNTSVNGIVILVLALLLIAILGGMYYWFSQLSNQVTPLPIERPTAEMNNEPESTTAEAAVETQGVLSPSDEIAAIEADINATNIDAVDIDLTTIDSEFNSLPTEPQ